MVVPLFNPDGNDALDPGEPPRSTCEALRASLGLLVGTRTQSHGINLNRDYLRQAGPEMRLLQARVVHPLGARPHRSTTTPPTARSTASR